MNAILFILSAAAAITTQSVMANSYSTPVPPELASENTWFPITAEATLVNRDLTIRYQLPEDLVGKNQPGITARGKSTGGSFIQVLGDDVEGVCMISNAKPLTCMLKYPDTIIDVPSRDEALKQHFQGTQFEARTKVARLFKNDPAGILSVTLK